MRYLYHPTILRARKGLSDQDTRRCDEAIKQFKGDIFHPSLNYERLGKHPRHNHCSIRASQELRLILAVEPNFQAPELVVFANMGHHDPMYDWAERQGYRTDPVDARDMDNRPGTDGSTTQKPFTLEHFEDWQVFLHPDQEPLVKHQYAAAARIRGAAGTGKTVIALHRAKELGHRYAGERVLFTTFSRSLSEHMKQLYERIPGTPANVEFRNIDRVAYSMVKPRMERRKVDQAFVRAYEAVIPGSVLERCSHEYLRDEIDKVIDGRAATREQYLDTDRFERMGRRRKFNRAEREVCWRLKETWDGLMEAADIISFSKILIAARDQAIAQNEPPYRAAIVDEAQDMTQVGMQLVRALVAGDPQNPIPSDGILLLDDAAQRIYAGGFRLTWAKIPVRGSSEILTTNYRNTKQIVEAANAVRGKASPVGGDEGDGAPPPREFDQRDGARPIWRQVAEKKEAPTMAETIKELIDERDFTPESIGVLARGNDDCRRIKKYFEHAFKIPSVDLKDLRNRGLAKGVRIGTFDRSKGLEFRAVLIPRLGGSQFPKAEDAPDDQVEISEIKDAPKELTQEQREARQLDLDRLYVGMTRARELLYLFSDESPCPEIERALDLMDCRS